MLDYFGIIRVRPLEILIHRAKSSSGVSGATQESHAAAQPIFGAEANRFQILLDQDGTVSVRTNHRYQFDSKRESGSCSFFNSNHEGSSGYAARSCSFLA